MPAGNRELPGKSPSCAPMNLSREVPHGWVPKGWWQAGGTGQGKWGSVAIPKRIQGGWLSIQGCGVINFAALAPGVVKKRGDLPPSKVWGTLWQRSTKAAHVPPPQHSCPSHLEGWGPPFNWFAPLLLLLCSFSSALHWLPGSLGSSLATGAAQRL